MTKKTQPRKFSKLREVNGFGMARMYEILSEDLPQEIKIFKKYSEGENWLLEQ